MLCSDAASRCGCLHCTRSPPSPTHHFDQPHVLAVRKSLRQAHAAVANLVRYLAHARALNNHVPRLAGDVPAGVHCRNRRDGHQRGVHLLRRTSALERECRHQRAAEVLDGRPHGAAIAEEARRLGVAVQLHRDRARRRRRRRKLHAAALRVGRQRGCISRRRSARRRLWRRQLDPHAVAWHRRQQRRRGRGITRCAARRRRRRRLAASATPA